MVSLKLSTTGFEAGDYLTIHFQSENVHQYIRLTQRAFEYTGYITNFNTVFTDAYHINRGYLEGATATVDLEVYDQFGAFIEDGWTARALLVDSYRPDGTDATSTTNSIVPIVGGKATMTITDNGKGLGWNWYEIEFIKRDLRNYEFDMDTQNTVSNFWFNIRNAEDLVPGKVTINSAAKDSSGTWQLNGGSFGASDNPIAVSTSDFGNWDSRDLLATEPTLQSRATFSGQIETLGTATYMSTYVSAPLVTIEGEGLQFNFGDDMLSAVQTDKASFYATETGYFWFQASSHITGEHTIKVTIGDIVSYVQFHVAAPLPNAGSKVVVTAPDWSLPGKTVVVSAVISDKFGNLVTNITPADLQVTGVTAANKVYNGNTAASLNGMAAVTALGSDVVTVSGAPLVPEPAAERGFKIERTYYTLDGKPADATKAKQNDRFAVVLKMTEPQPQFGRIIVADYLPAGFEIGEIAIHVSNARRNKAAAVSGSPDSRASTASFASASTNHETPCEYCPPFSRTPGGYSALRPG
mgnify:CR=1 FL=1